MQPASARPFAQRAAFRRLSIAETPWISEREPRRGDRVAVLASDGAARYVLPFACSCDAGSWHNADTGAVLRVAVVGWHGLPR